MALSREELGKLGTDVAELLPGKWTARPVSDNDWCVDLVNAENPNEPFIVKIFSRTGYSDTGRLEIEGRLPHGVFEPWSYGNHHITVAEHRPVKAVASEIARRVLPGFRQAVTDAYDKHRAKQAKARAISELAQELADICHGRAAAGGNVRALLPALHGKGYARVIDANTVSFVDLVVSAEVARRIVAVLAELRH